MSVAAAGVAALAMAAAGLAAVGGTNAEGITDRVGEALGLRDGKYHTTSFEPAFSVTLPKEWTVAVDKVDAFIPRNLDRGPDDCHVLCAPEFVFGIYKPLAWADPANEDRGIVPVDIIAWLQAHPYLDADEPTTYFLASDQHRGGIEGTQIDAVCTCPLGQSVPLFYLENPYAFTEASRWGEENRYTFIEAQRPQVSLQPGVRYRFIVLEIAGADIVVVTPGIFPPHFGPTDFQPFVRFVRPMLDSLVFEVRAFDGEGKGLLR